MTCDEAAEFVSALCDGETIPRTAAEHVGACEACQTQLKDYMAMGAELRRVASLEFPEEARPRVWEKREGALANWWQKGWETMRIPRLAFALMLAGIVGLGSTLAIVGVRAHTKGTVVLVKVTPPGGQSNLCPLSTEDKKWQVCGLVGGVNSGILSYQLKMLSRDGDRIKLGVRAEFTAVPAGSHTTSLASIDTLPEREYWFEPGETLQLEVAGLGAMELTGEWMDHMPSIIAKNHDLDPGPEELRMVSPLLLRGTDVVGDLEGGSAFIDKTGQGITIYIPGEGSFELSLSPMAGAIQGRAKLNRLSFEINGEQYAFLTGTPIARSEKVWVLRDAKFKPPAGSGDAAFIGSFDLNRVLPPASDKN